MFFFIVVSRLSDRTRWLNDRVHLFLWDSLSQLECWQFVWWQSSIPWNPLNFAQRSCGPEIRIHQLSPLAARKALARIASPSLFVIVGQRQRNTIPASLWPMDSMVPLMSLFFFVWVEWSGFHQCWISSKSLKISLQTNNQSAGGLPGGLFFEKSSSTKTAVCLAGFFQVKSWSFWPPWHWRRCL